MANFQCPTCGREIASGAACTDCGHTAENGAADGLAPVPPPEVASWIIERPSPDVLAWARQTFNEEPALRCAAIRRLPVKRARASASPWERLDTTVAPSAGCVRADTGLRTEITCGPAPQLEEAGDLRSHHH